MRFEEHGSATSGVEVVEIAPTGLSLRVEGEEFRLTFDDFPWFAGADDAALTHVVRPSPEHLRWPALDIDLDIDSIRHPERFPLVSRERLSG